jgi:DNA repair protein RadC
VSEVVKLLTLGEIEMGNEEIGTSFHEGEDVRDLSVLKERLIAQLGGKEYEVLWAVFIDGGGKLKGIQQVAKGNSNQVQAPKDEIFAAVKAAGVEKFALLHNHPGDTGDATPSRQDMMVTFATLIEAKFEGLQLVDHLIVNRDNVGSIRQQRNL